MTIKKSVEAKAAMENQIFESIMAFELETGLTVNHIRIIHDGRIKTNTDNMWKDRLSVIKTESILDGNTC